MTAEPPEGRGKRDDGGGNSRPRRSALVIRCPASVALGQGPWRRIRVGVGRLVVVVPDVAAVAADPGAARRRAAVAAGRAAAVVAVAALGVAAVGVGVAA